MSPSYLETYITLSIKLEDSLPLSISQGVEKCTVTMLSLLLHLLNIIINLLVGTNKLYKNGCIEAKLTFFPSTLIGVLERFLRAT